ncbi:MAG: nuclear transport factor 2 family protein [Acidimicrobiia bacterium]
MSQEDDLRTIEAMHERYLVLNGEVNYEKLPELWSAYPDNWYFNLTGHNYHGLEHWLDLWRHYHGKIITVSPWESHDRVIRVDGDVAWVTCARTAEIIWKGEGEAPTQTGPVESRSTEIYYREPDGWRVVHAHFSRSSSEPRPGGI